MRAEPGIMHVGLAALLAFAPCAAVPQTLSPFNPLISWNAATESRVDDAWDPALDPLGGTQVWTWNTTNPVALVPLALAAAPGLKAAFRFDEQDEGLLSPSNPQTIPLDPTDQSASFELWLRPDRLDAGRQVIASFGAKITGSSLTLENDTLRFQVRNSDVRPAIDTNSVPDGVADDGLEDLVASVKTRVVSTNEFTHVVATIELGGTNQHVALYVDGALATPIDDSETGLFKDESLIQTGKTFAPVPETHGSNPVSLRTTAEGPVPGLIFHRDWSGNAAARLGRHTGDVGGTSDPAGGPLFLNDFKNTTFQGDIAILNLYSRALSQAQVSALHQQVLLNTNWPSTLTASPGLVLNFEAAIGALSGSDIWENLCLLNPSTNTNGFLPASDALDWHFSAPDGSNFIVNTGSPYPALSAAYRFTSQDVADDGRLATTYADGSVADSLAELLGNNFGGSDAAFELWFKPSDLTGKEVLFETGGSTDGLSLRLNGASLEFVVRNGSNPEPESQEAIVSTLLTFEQLGHFIQAVAVVDIAAARIRLFVNGLPEAEAAFTGTSWDGGDPACLGGIANNLGGGQDSGFGGFEGAIAIVRGYSQALSEIEILDSYSRVLSGAVIPLPPTDIRLLSSSAPENLPPNFDLGPILASDPNPGDTHTFELVAGEGDADNGLFTITGDHLVALGPFDFEARSVCNLRVRATDSSGLSLEKPLQLSIDNLNEINPASVLPPNIIVYMCDDMGIGEASPYLGRKLGPNAAPVSKVLQTPQLDRLASYGTLFTDVHTGSSMCSPTRYAILTGRYAWRSYNKHRVIGGWNSPPMIAPNRPTLASLLKNYGYRTAAFGKWHLGWTLLATNGLPVPYYSVNEATWATVRLGTNADGSFVSNILDGPLAHGFDYYFGVTANFANDTAGTLKGYIENNSILGFPTWGGAPPQAGKICAGPGVPDWDQQRMGEKYMNKALDYIDNHVARGSNAPFFFYFVPNANHAPCDPADAIVVQGQSIPIRDQARFSDGSDGGNRQDMIYENNVAVGLLLDKLQALNDPRTSRPLFDSTLFIFTSDNGPDAFGVGQAGLRDKKTALYEGGHRVPFIVSWPDGGVPSNSVSSANFGQFDLYASFASLLKHKLGPDEAEDSANALSALLVQTAGPQFTRSHHLVSHDDSLSANDIPDDSALAIREHPHVLMIDGSLVNRQQKSGPDYGSPKPIKLFDLDADLHQDLNLLSQPSFDPLINDLTQRLLYFHNAGHSRDLQLTGFDQLLLSDGGADLRNDRSGAIGYEFATGGEPLVIQSLGLWDDSAADYTGNEVSSESDGQTAGTPDGLASPHTVRLFDADSHQLIASVIVSNANSYLMGEFRYVDLPEPIMLDSHKSYALSVSTTPGDGDLFHHFASFTGVSPSPSDLVGEFIARISPTELDYPGLFPDGPDGAANRHLNMFRHRMFVGPNARITPFRIASAVSSGSDLLLNFPAGTNILYRLEGSPSLSPPDWQTLQTDIPGRNGFHTLSLTNAFASEQFFYRIVKQ